jgi:hypothetical protein
MKAANSIVIAVTAPDGVTKQTYAVSYTYYYDKPNGWLSGCWTVDGSTGFESSGRFQTVTAALNYGTYGIKDTYNSTWPGGKTKPVAARIEISIDITSTVSVADTGLYTTLPPIILTGTGKTIDPSPGRPLTITEAAVILEGSLTLTGGNDSDGGGVHVTGANSSFTMNGGTISGNTAVSNSSGGGVFVSAGGSFIMNDGTIGGSSPTDKNTAGTGGGVFVAGATSSFIMNGGTISGNTAGGGGGVYVAGGAFTMNGGTIGGSAPNHANNDGGGVYVTGNGNMFTMHGGTISGNTAGNGGGGVCAAEDGKFSMKGGSVRKNSAQRGGGVMIFNSAFASIGGGIFNMEGGSINENTSTGAGTIDYGGGVLLFNDKNVFTMSGGIISGNSAVKTGGGVALGFGNNNTFTMSGGTINGNTAKDGGGVYVNSGGTFTMNNGTVSGNTANDNGGGVWVSNSSVFNMEAGAVISQENDVWLAAGKTITITAALTGTSYAARITPESYSPLPQVLSGSGTIVPNYLKFTVTPYSGTNYTIKSDGCLQVQP